MNVALRSLSILALGALAGCSRPPSASEGTAAAPLSSAVAARPGDGGAPAASAKAERPAVVRYRGTYEARVASFYVPEAGDVTNYKEWENTKWRGDDAGAGVGEGTLTLEVDTATGRVSGLLEGPLGPATLAGFVDGAKVTATLARRDPSDFGFMGTLVGVREGGEGAAATTLKGNLRASIATARLIREGTFTLSATP